MARIEGTMFLFFFCLVFRQDSLDLKRKHRKNTVWWMSADIVGTHDRYSPQYCVDVTKWRDAADDATFTSLELAWRLLSYDMQILVAQAIGRTSAQFGS